MDHNRGLDSDDAIVDLDESWDAFARSRGVVRNHG
jgi:hypothetical protein